MIETLVVGGVAHDGANVSSSELSDVAQRFENLDRIVILVALLEFIAMEVMWTAFHPGAMLQRGGLKSDDPMN